MAEDTKPKDAPPAAPSPAVAAPPSPAPEPAPPATERMDETIPGGLYIAGEEDGKPRYVNANGEPTDSKGNVKK